MHPYLSKNKMTLGALWQEPEAETKYIFLSQTPSLWPDSGKGLFQVRILINIFFSLSWWWVLPFHPLRVKGQNYLEVSVTAEGRKKLSLQSSPLSMAKPSCVLFPSTCNALPPLFVDKFLHIFQVSSETTPPPRSPLCPWRGSQSLASLSCCWVHVCLSNQLPHSVDQFH